MPSVFHLIAWVSAEEHKNQILKTYSSYHLFIYDTWWILYEVSTHTTVFSWQIWPFQFKQQTDAVQNSWTWIREAHRETWKIRKCTWRLLSRRLKQHDHNKYSHMESDVCIHNQYPSIACVCLRSLCGLFHKGDSFHQA